MIAAPVSLARYSRLMLGDEPARRDGVDAHALEGELEAERLGELDHAGLGGRIGDGALGHAEAEHRGDVDDRAPLAGRQHAARGLLRPEEHRVEIGAEDAPPFLLGQLDGAGRVRDAGIVDQDGDGAERLSRRRRRRASSRRGRARRPRSRWRGRRPPRSRACTAASRSARRATSATAAPFAASTSAKRTPSPLDAPVTSATRPVRSNRFGGFHARSPAPARHKAHAAARSQAPARTTAPPARRAGSARTE